MLYTLNGQSWIEPILVKLRLLHQKQHIFGELWMVPGSGMSQYIPENASSACSGGDDDIPQKRAYWHTVSGDVFHGPQIKKDRQLEMPNNSLSKNEFCHTTVPLGMCTGNPWKV